METIEYIKMTGEPLINSDGEWVTKPILLLICPICSVGAVLRHKPTGKEENGVAIMETTYERAFLTDGENRTCKACGHEFTIKSGD